MKIRSVSALAFLLSACGTSEPPARIVVPRGASVAAVSESLAAHQVIGSPRLFRLYTRLTGRSDELQAGTYDVPRDASYERTIRILTKGVEATARLVVPEGLMLVEVGDAMKHQLGIPRESVMAVARDQAFVTSLHVPAGSLEGYLYPSTYLVPVSARARDVLQQMVAEFERQWKPEWTARAESLRLSRHQVVTLASIIEGEVRHANDRSYVSSVYRNRLAQGMKLQADPTVIYALGRRRRLYEKDYLTRSPYNTYLIVGLPPGPIGQPSAASIEAALYPARTPYFFFVARSDGRHIFSRTHNEHLAAIREVRSGARRRGQARAGSP